MFRSPDGHPKPKPVWYYGTRERMETTTERRAVAEDFFDFLTGLDTILGADAHRGAFSEQTSKIFAGLDLHNPPSSLYDTLPTGCEPDDESWKSLRAMWAELDRKATDDRAQD